LFAVDANEKAELAAGLNPHGGWLGVAGAFP
jgi:hypothetical protein